MKHVEGYVFIPWGGQFRFALKVTVKLGAILCESNPAYDYYFEGCDRGVPTLRELYASAANTFLLRGLIEGAFNEHTPLPKMTLCVSIRKAKLYPLDVLNDIRIEFVLIN